MPSPSTSKRATCRSTDCTEGLILINSEEGALSCLVHRLAAVAHLVRWPKRQKKLTRCRAA